MMIRGSRSGYYTGKTATEKSQNPLPSREPGKVIDPLPRDAGCSLNMLLWLREASGGINPSPETRYASL